MSWERYRRGLGVGSGCDISLFACCDWTEECANPSSRSSQWTAEFTREGEVGEVMELVIFGSVEGGDNALLICM